jgi:hypothetical protein
MYPTDDAIMPEQTVIALIIALILANNLVDNVLTAVSPWKIMAHRQMQMEIKAWRWFTAQSRMNRDLPTDLVEKEV